MGGCQRRCVIGIAPILTGAASQAWQTAMGRAGWPAPEYQLPYGCQVLGAWLSGVQYAEKQQLSVCMQGLYEDAAYGCTVCALRTAVARSAA